MSLWTDFRDTAIGTAKQEIGETFFETTREESQTRPSLTTSTGVEPLSPTARESYQADNTGSSRPASDIIGPEGGFKISPTMLIGGIALLAVAIYLKAN